MTERLPETLVGETLRLKRCKRAYLPGVRNSPGKIAVVATHGMGQQTPFETIDAIARGIIGAAPDKVLSPVTARTVQVGKQRLQRAELRMLDADGETVDVHIYEGYWAPLTEGQTTLRDVLHFLCNGALNGIANCGGHFWRHVFGDYRDFGRQCLRNRGWLLATLAAVLSVLTLTVLAAIVTGRALVMEVGISGNLWPGPHLLALYTNIAAAFVGASLLFLGPIGLLNFLRARPGRKRPYWRAACWLASGLLRLWLLVSVLCAFMVLALAVRSLCPSKPLPQPWVDFPAQVAAILWVLLYVVAIWLRSLVVQYLGDVAAYVQPHLLDRFLTIRLQIKAWVMDAVSAVYQATNAEGDYEYEGIVMVGHSLGSVVAYDTLNALIIADALEGNQGGVVARTRAFITFGSPLDKTAFVFGLRKKDTSIIRETLAASVQPLIQDPGRPFEWINIHSDRDLISNDLRYYDLPGGASPAGALPIRNEKDPDALIPLAAHIEYWRNPTLFRFLYSKL